MKAGLATSLSIVGVLATGGAALVLNSSILNTESSAKGSPAFATVVGLEAQGGVTPLGDGATPGSVAELSADGVADLITGNNPPMVNPVVVSPRVSSAAASPSTQSNGSTSGTASSTAGATGAATGGIKQAQANLTATETTEVASPTTVAPAPTTTAPGATPTTTVAPNIEKQFKVGDAATITLVINGTKLLVKDIVITPGTGYKVTNQMSRDGNDVRITLTSPTRMLEFSARLVNGQIMAAVSAPSSGNLTPPPPPRRHHDDDDDHEEREHDENHEEREREHDDDD